LPRCTIRNERHARLPDSPMRPTALFLEGVPSFTLRTVAKRGAFGITTPSPMHAAAPDSGHGVRIASFRHEAAVASGGASSDVIHRLLVREIARLGLKRGRLLDFGCGRGTLLRRIRQLGV